MRKEKREKKRKSFETSRADKALMVSGIVAIALLFPFGLGSLISYAALGFVNEATFSLATGLIGGSLLALGATITSLIDPGRRMRVFGDVCIIVALLMVIALIVYDRHVPEVISAGLCLLVCPIAVAALVTGWRRRRCCYQDTPKQITGPVDSDHAIIPIWRNRHK